MAKKNFTAAAGSKVFDAIREATAESPAQPVAAQSAPQTEGQAAAYKEQASHDAELQQARAAHRTQGRRGLKMQRVNMAFSPDVYEYIRTMSRASGLTITAFTEAVFAQHMDANRDKFEKARELSALMAEE